MTNPVLVEVTRGEMVESRHRGAYAVCRADGELVAGAGDMDALIYPRSAIKPLQAIPLVETGAADRFKLDHKRLSLSCASHNGEPEHVAEVKNWLDHIGASENTLCCAGHYAGRQQACIEQVRSGVVLTPALNNCSGKHTGFLTTAVHLGESLDGYETADHPVQQRLVAILEELGDTDLSRSPGGVDGCGIPVIGMKLNALARAMAQMADPGGLSPVRREAVTRIREAVAAEPFYIAGSGRFCTEVMRVTGSRALMKVGAEGVYCAALPEKGLGIALKIDDGGVRAAERLMAALLEAHGAVTTEEADAMPGFFRPTVTNWAGRPVGEIRPNVAAF